MAHTQVQATKIRVYMPLYIGYFGLAPNVWVPKDPQSPSKDKVQVEALLAINPDDTGTYSRPIRYGHRDQLVAHVSVKEDRASQQLQIFLDQPVTNVVHRHQICQKIIRITRLNLDLSDFHRKHPAAKHRGFGRLFRSPTLWEDIVKVNK